MKSEAPLSEEERQWQHQFKRKLEEVQGGRTFSTAFLDPRRLELAESALNKYPALSYVVYGGYPEAERNALQIFPAQHKGSLPPVAAVLVKWSGKEKELSHRDILGAVLALGLRRDQVGDIIMLEENGAVMMVMESKAEYICANLIQAGPVAVNCSVIDPGQEILPAKEGKEIKGTVASLRVDAVLSLGFGISRSRVVLLVKGGLVRVNWRPVDSPSLQLKEEDQISLKGRGRLLIEAVEGETRKGRIRVRLKKYG